MFGCRAARLGLVVVACLCCWPRVASATVVVLAPGERAAPLVEALKIQLTPERVQVRERPRRSASAVMADEPAVLAVVWFSAGDTYLLLRRSGVEPQVFSQTLAELSGPESGAAARGLALQLAHLYLQAFEESRVESEPAVELEPEPAVEPGARAQSARPSAVLRAGLGGALRLEQPELSAEVSAELGVLLPLGAAALEPLLSLGYVLPRSAALESAAGTQSVQLEQWAPAVGLGLTGRWAQLGLGTSLQGRLRVYRASADQSAGAVRSVTLLTPAAALQLRAEVRVAGPMWLRLFGGAELAPKRPRFQFEGRDVARLDFWAFEFGAHTLIAL